MDDWFERHFGLSMLAGALALGAVWVVIIGVVLLLTRIV